MTTYNVTLEPIEEEFECGDDETVLEAALRNGYNLVHGCREGRCTACKSYLAEGYVDLKPYSTFALSESEEEEGFTLLCRAMPESDLVIELLHYDPDGYRLENPVRELQARVQELAPLTHDVMLLALEVEGEPLAFKPGQYVDLFVPGTDERRSYSMANLPGNRRLEFVIKRYPGGVLSGLLGGDLKVGDEMRLSGPYGNCVLDHSSAQEGCLLIAGGSGMAPMLALLREIAESDRTAMPVTFFYGGRAPRDLFYVDLIQELGSKLERFEFLPVLSDLPETETWDGERGLLHEAVDRFLTDCSALSATDHQVYMAGPQVMVDTVFELLTKTHQLDAALVAFDTFG
ncbi:MAG: propane monooxygenase reductase component [Solirubrobacteraceae bacterium]|jgi:propane monooxygenase reductase subunit|nr:propane monooxygenase reductase component [Solirubrobacteraceae bacterium]